MILEHLTKNCLNLAKTFEEIYKGEKETVFFLQIKFAVSHSLKLTNMKLNLHFVGLGTVFCGALAILQIENSIIYTAIQLI